MITRAWKSNSGYYNYETTECIFTFLYIPQIIKVSVFILKSNGLKFRIGDGFSLHAEVHFLYAIYRIA